jgi:hypothetical protein
MKQDEYELIYPSLMRWIDDLRARLAPAAQVVLSLPFDRLPRYFSAAHLSSVKAVVVEEMPIPPLELIGMGKFSLCEEGTYQAITYNNISYISKSCANTESVYFHCVVHTVQWRELGPKRFMAMYAAGMEQCDYQHNPLEAMAYAAEDLFMHSSAPFNAEQYVLQALYALLRGDASVIPAQGHIPEYDRAGLR